jgi:hypothetical protein
LLRTATIKERSTFDIIIEVNEAKKKNGIERIGVYEQIPTGGPRKMGHKLNSIQLGMLSNVKFLAE